MALRSMAGITLVVELGNWTLLMFVMLLWVCIHTRQAWKYACPRWKSNLRALGVWNTNPIMCQLSYAVRSVWGFDNLELSPVPSIYQCNLVIMIFLCWRYVLTCIWCTRLEVLYWNHRTAGWIDNSHNGNYLFPPQAL